MDKAVICIIWILFRTSEKYVCARIFLNSFMCLSFNCRTYRYVDLVLFVVSYVM